MSWLRSRGGLSDSGDESAAYASSADGFDQCTELDMAIVPIDDVVVWRAPIHVAREVAGYAKFWFTNPC